VTIIIMTIPVLFSFSSSLFRPPKSDHASRPSFVLVLSGVNTFVALPSVTHTLSPFKVLNNESVSSDELF